MGDFVAGGPRLSPHLIDIREIRRQIMHINVPIIEMLLAINVAGLLALNIIWPNRKVKVGAICGVCVCVFGGIWRAACMH